MTALSVQCPTCGASIGAPCRPDGGTCRHRGAALTTHMCFQCGVDRPHAIDGAQHECVRCGLRSWPVAVPETPAQAEERARLSNPVGDRMIAMFRGMADAYLAAAPTVADGRDEETK